MTRTNIETIATCLNGLLAVAAIAVILAGCRSDGGIGRRDSQRSLTNTLDMIERQYEADVAKTKANLTRISDAYSNDLADPWHEVHRTVDLYLEGHADQ